MRDDNPCKCCGVPLGPDPMRVAHGLCPICDCCDHLHGERLERAVRHLLEHKQIDFGTALVRCAVDDAHLTGLIEYRGPRHAAEIWIRRAPRPWEVVVGRACALGEVVAIADVVAACLAPFIPGKVNRETLDAIATELRGALNWIDHDITDVEVDCKRDVLDPEHLLINITKSTNVMPGTIAMHDPNVEIPDYITRSKPAQA